MKIEEFKKWRKHHITLIEEIDDYMKLFSNPYRLEKLTEKDLNNELESFKNDYENERKANVEYLANRYHITNEVAYDIYPVYNTLRKRHDGEEPAKNALKPAINDAYYRLYGVVRK